MIEAAEVVTDQDFHSQTVESASCGLVDGRKPRCYEPPEEDTGSVIHQFLFKHACIAHQSQSNLSRSGFSFVLCLYSQQACWLIWTAPMQSQRKTWTECTFATTWKLPRYLDTLTLQDKNPAKNRTCVLVFFFFLCIYLKGPVKSK